MFGHAAANPSYVTRPSKSASASNSSSYLNLSPSAARSNSNVHRGSSTTPSSDTNSVTTILLIFLPSVGRQPDLVPACHDLYERAVGKSTAPTRFLPEAPAPGVGGPARSSVRLAATPCARAPHENHHQDDRHDAEGDQDRDAPPPETSASIDDPP